MEQSQTISFVAAILAAAPNALASPDECDHRLTVGVNDGLCVCLVCRTKVSKVCEYAIMIEAGPSPGLPLFDELVPTYVIEDKHGL
jgi:hypothetical protein